MAAKANLVTMEAPALLPVTHHMDLSANAHLAFLVLHVNMMHKSVELFTATMGEHVYLDTKVLNVCVLHHLLDLNANSLLTVDVLQIHATMVVHVRPLLKLHSIIVPAPLISSVNDATSWIVVCKKKNVKFLNVSN